MLPVSAVENKPGLKTFYMDFDPDLLVDLETGASVAFNGCCFTVTSIQGSRVSFDAIQETLNITNLKYIETGTMLNVERSAKSDAEVGGHVLSGHIVDTAKVLAIDVSENNQRWTFQGDPSWLKFVFNKGFLAVNGCSLTVADLNREQSQFAINLIPETLARTNFAILSVGDEVNVEVESQTQVIVETVERTVERLLAERFAN